MDEKLIEAASHFVEAVVGKNLKPVAKKAKASLKLPVSDAYWISPAGKIFDVGQIHIVTITENPEAFGLTRPEIDAVYEKYGEPIGSEGKARDEIMVKLIEERWIRVRRIPKQDVWTIQVDADSVHRIPKHKITDFLMKLVIQNPKYKYSMVSVINLNGESLYYNDIDEALNGEDDPLTEAHQPKNVIEVVDIKKVSYAYLIG
jgi:hypothetical protein